MKVITDYDYDNIEPRNIEYDYDYLMSCDRLQSITEYDYGMPDIYIYIYIYC